MVLHNIFVVAFFKLRVCFGLLRHLHAEMSMQSEEVVDRKTTHNVFSCQVCGMHLNYSEFT